jgi:GcrA cell cycle regulator
MAWNERMHEMVVNGLQEGLSASRIARRLGGIGEHVTRSAVIGYMHRNNLKASPYTPKQCMPRQASMIKPTPRVSDRRELQKRLDDLKAVGAQMRQAVKPAPVASEVSAVTLLDLREHMCRWPIGDPRDEDFRFCGRHKEHGSYCADHARKAFADWQPPRARRKAA